MKRIACFLSIMLLLCTTVLNARDVINFNKDWSFALNPDESKGLSSPEYDDSGWRILNLPHDWAIEGDFDERNPSGTGGGALPGGIGWYRNTFKVSENDRGQVFRIEFDGVYMNSSVYINGHLLGTRPYGYISFSYDLTPYINWGGVNVIAVRVDNSDQPNSRWYSGCGIFRDVRLVKVNQVHIAEWGTYVSTPTVSRDKALVKVSATINDGNDIWSKVTRNLTVKSTIKDSEGKAIITSTTSRELNWKGEEPVIVVDDSIWVDSPHLWSVDDPYMYTLVTELTLNGKRVDTYETPFGIRTIEFRADSGFYLNGEHVRINGVCNHHDLGCLGAATNERAIERQLEILKAMGCNGIRCSHNPPSPILLDLCDRMGFLVMDEAFDMWRRRKTDRDYARFFDEWHERDLTDLVVRDRNHPSIVLWSIGNEVLEQWSDAKADTLSLEQANLILNMGHSSDQLAQEGEMSVNSLITARLAEIIKNLDPTRPVTAGCNEPSPGNHLFRSGAIDVIGYNYHNQNVPAVPRLFPGKPFIITESVSALMTRGFYEMPSDKMMQRPARWDRPYFNPTFSCSAYDNVRTPWGSHHEENLIFLNSQPFVAGQYIWTGFDYIGEPTPYGWPARSSYFGIVDLAGFPKDIYYLYQSESGPIPPCCTCSPTGTGHRVNRLTCGATTTMPMRLNSI